MKLASALGKLIQLGARLIYNGNILGGISRSVGSVGIPAVKDATEPVDARVLILYKLIILTFYTCKTSIRELNG